MWKPAARQAAGNYMDGPIPKKQRIDMNNQNNQGQQQVNRQGQQQPGQGASSADTKQQPPPPPPAGFVGTFNGPVAVVMGQPLL